jgi:hypothetical protein
MAKTQTGKRYSIEERANLLAVWDAAQGTNAGRFGAVQTAGYAGGLSGWLQNVRSWRGPKKVTATAEPVAKKSKAAAAPKSGMLKRGRVGPEERVKIVEMIKSGKSAADIASHFSRSENVVAALMEQPKAGKPSKSTASAVAADVQHADPLSGIPTLFRDEFISMVLEKIEQVHKHRVSDKSKSEAAVHLFFQIKEIMKDYDKLIEKLKSL